MRYFFLSLLSFTGVSLPAQVTRKFMGEIVKQYEKSSSYLRDVKGAPSARDTAYLVPQFDRFTAMISSVYEDADFNQKKVILYYKTMLEIRMGYMYAAGHYDTDAYQRFYKLAQIGMAYITQPGWFPVKYETDSLEYTLDRTYVTQVESIFYLDLLRTALNSGSWSGARSAYIDIRSSGTLSHLDKYVASGTYLFSIINGKKIADMSTAEKDDLFEIYVENIRQLGALDAKDKDPLVVNKKADYEARYNEVMELTQPWEPVRKALAYEKLGTMYWGIKDTAKASFFFTNVMNTDYYFGAGNLYAAAEVAIATKDKNLCVRVAGKYLEDPGIDKECYHLSVIGHLYEVAGNMTEAKNYIRKSNKCGKRNR